MLPPDELMTESFLPSMRQLAAQRLRKEGLSQNRVASLLGITQASVSLYLESGPKKAYSTLESFSVSHKQADDYASSLTGAVKKSSSEGVGMLYSIWTDLLGRGNACGPHRVLYPSLADCDMCIKEFGGGGGTRAEAIREVAQAVKILEGSVNFVQVMPEVSVNIACVAGGAESPADVVAIPGRIVKVKGRAKAMLPPEAGASAHMARVLLLVKGSRSDIRACVNLRFDRRMGEAVKKLGLRTMRLKNYPDTGDDPTIGALERSLKSSPGRFDALVDEGGSGIEPNLYLFSDSARGAAEEALEVADAYSAV